LHRFEDDVAGDEAENRTTARRYRHASFVKVP
jgi:hypothetical protein